MNWYDGIINDLEFRKNYNHKDLINILKKGRPDLSENSYHWIINSLVDKGIIEHKGYNAYALSDGDKKEEYKPLYSKTAMDVIKLISEKYPLVTFTVFETVLMNDFLNHLIAQNTVFIQVEKESSIFVFRFLQEKGYKDILYRPSKREFDLYRSKNGIIVTDLISEAPLRNDDPHSVLLEKMLVDMCADRLISSTFNKSEMPAVFEHVRRNFRLDEARLLRYARRRNRHDEIKKYLEGEYLVNDTERELYGSTYTGNKKPNRS